MRVFAAVLAAAAAVAAQAATLESRWSMGSAAAADEQMTFHVQLKQENLDVLDEVFKAVTDPKSAQYGKYLSKEQLNELTAAKPETVAAAQAYFKAAGVDCALLTKDALKCKGSVASIEAMLKTKVHAFQHSKTGAKALRINRAVGYTFPAELQGKVELMTGLFSLPPAREARAGRLATEAARQLGKKIVHTQLITEEWKVVEDSSESESQKPAAAAATTASAATKAAQGSSLKVVPETLQTMYGTDGATATSGTTVAPAEFQDLGSFSPDDLSTFISNTGVVTFKPDVVYGPTTPSNPQAESTLDIQYVGAMAPAAAVQYFTIDAWMFEFSTAALAGTFPVPDIISMSYGWSEVDQCEISSSSKPCSSGGGSSAFVAAVNTNFQKLGAAGHTLLASSGDAGSHGRSDDFCSGAKTHPAFPASSPYVTAVGATQLAADAQQGGSSPICQSQLQCAVSGTEIVSSTSTGSLITSGGGFSEYAPMPDYQKSAVAQYLATASNTPGAGNFNPSGRAYPDVSALGHNYYIQLQGQVQSVDGTSASCPVFAGILALVNSARVAAGKPKLGFANPWIYQLPSAAFNDITVGDNKCTEYTCCSTGFAAAPGFDAVTGRGTPNFKSMLQADREMLGLPALSQQQLDSIKVMLRGSK